MTTVAMPSDQLMTFPVWSSFICSLLCMGPGLSLIYIDVNEHMEIHATHGRQMLSEALSHVVACIKRHIRLTMLCFDMGAGSL